MQYVVYTSDLGHTPKHGVTETEPVEPKLFEASSQSRNYLAINIYCSQCGGWRHISYVSTRTVIVHF